MELINMASHRPLSGKLLAVNSQSGREFDRVLHRRKNTQPGVILSNHLYSQLSDQNRSHGPAKPHRP